jgi:hypothetical protein
MRCRLEELCPKASGFELLWVQPETPPLVKTSPTLEESKSYVTVLDATATPAKGRINKLKRLKLVFISIGYLEV